MKFTLYCLIEDGTEQPCKVGIATNLATRFCSLQGGNWRPLKISWQVQFGERDNALEVERHILSRLRPSAFSDTNKFGKRKRLKSEWLDATAEEAYAAGKDLIEALLELESR